MSYQFQLVPRDVLFLRDARPMEAADAGLGANWPRPDQLYNAVHHAFLTQWPDRQPWEGAAHTTGLPGDKNQDSSFRFGALKTFGPFPKKGGEVYLPCPLDVNMHVLRCEGTNLPAPLSCAFLPNEKKKTSLPAWIPASLYRKYVAGQDIQPVDGTDAQLYGKERNIGVAIDPETGTTKTGQFYQAEYLRLQEGVSLYFEAECVLKLKREDKEHDVFTQEDLPRQVVMGGQQGICAMAKAESTFPELTAPVTTRWLRWTLLTPAVFANGWMPGWLGADGRVMLPRCRVERLPNESRQAWKVRQNAATGFDARLIAARVGKPIVFSGWDLLKGSPKPTQLAVSAGSSYVFACKDETEAKALAKVLSYPNRRSDSYGEKGSAWESVLPSPFTSNNKGEFIMQTKLMTIFTRTPLHVGAGASVGAVDQPVIRERHTRFPVIPGSSIKGVLADLFTERKQATDKDGGLRFSKDKEAVMVRTGTEKILFGSDDELRADSGALAIGEAKLLAFPVRSAKGCFAFLTSPLCLERFAREAGENLSIPSGFHVNRMECYAGSDVIFEEKDEKAVILEEYKFSCLEEFPQEWADKLIGLLAGDSVLEGSKHRFVLVSDEDLSFYAENACQISQHVSIDSETGTAAEGKLFNQEEVPSETLFYTPITLVKNPDKPDRRDSLQKAFESFCAKFEKESLVQFGGKGTTGIGYCSVKLS